MPIPLVLSHSSGGRYAEIGTIIRREWLKPGVHVKYPWHLEIGDHAWIGERAWIDNFVHVRIGAHACVSQGAYVCTGKLCRLGW